MSKETYKRDVYMCERRPTKETCISVKRELQKRRVHLSKETYQRDVYMCQKRPTQVKCIPVKRDLQKRRVPCVKGDLQKSHTVEPSDAHILWKKKDKRDI